MPRPAPLLPACLLALLSVSACRTGDPQTPADCAASTGAAADECYQRVAPAVFRQSPEAGIALVEEKIQDPTVRDFVYLSVTREVDPNTTRYCDRIKDKTFADRCRVLVSRPHLHRDLTGQDRPPGSPPPGTPPANPPPGEAPGAPPPAGQPGALPGAPK